MQILFAQIPDSLLLEHSEEQAEQRDEQDHSAGELYPFGVRREHFTAKLITFSSCFSVDSKDANMCSMNIVGCVYCCVSGLLARIRDLLGAEHVEKQPGQKVQQEQYEK